jgi:hypothetical protein
MSLADGKGFFLSTLFLKLIIIIRLHTLLGRRETRRQLPPFVPPSERVCLCQLLVLSLSLISIVFYMLWYYTHRSDVSRQFGRLVIVRLITDNQQIHSIVVISLLIFIWTIAIPYEQP